MKCSQVLKGLRFRCCTNGKAGPTSVQMDLSGARCQLRGWFLLGRGQGGLGWKNIMKENYLMRRDPVSLALFKEGHG